MRLNKTLFRLLVLWSVLNFGCAQSPSESAATQNFTGTSFSTVGSYSSNQMTVYVNGSNSLGCGSTNPQYSNEPCVSVTICSTSDSSQCQTINDILLDTGSYGLRLFNSVISVPLTPVTSGSYTLAECTSYLDGSSEWGPVKYAYVQLGGEPMVAVPIEVIQSDYASPPSPCTAANSTPDTSPYTSEFNGILGIGLFSQDCGENCVNDGTAGSYYACSSTGDCSARATATLNAQVTNPVSALPTDNNGVMMVMNSVAAGGAASSTGTLYFGIGTESNNAGTGTALAADPTYLEFWTLYSGFSSGNLMGGFIDSGSNSLSFPKPTNGIYDCASSSYSGWFCGSSTGTSGTTVSASATNYAYADTALGYNSSVYTTTSFSVGNAETLFPSGNAVFAELAGDTGSSDPYFDWGLPFFFGKTVYVGIAGKTASGFSGTNTGPFWAYH